MWTQKYLSKTFDEVVPSEDALLEIITDFDKYTTTPWIEQQEDIDFIYILLSARYGNHPIAGTEERFKKRLGSLVFQFYPTWKKKLDVQSMLRQLSLSELQTGDKIIMNEAKSPSDYTVSTSDTTTLDYIDLQNTQNTKKGKLEAYSDLLAVLKTDVTEEFLKHFASLFQKIIIKEWV